jgi:hypothetical protein
MHERGYEIMEDGIYDPLDDEDDEDEMDFPEEV